MNTKPNQGDVPSPSKKKWISSKGFSRRWDRSWSLFPGAWTALFFSIVAHKELGDRAVALVASSPTYPDFEITKAKEILREWGVRLVEVHSNELEIPAFKENSPRRCYYCKQELFQKCREKAEAMGLRYVADGANFDDRGDYRPGMEAGRELGIRSPLMEAGFTKADIREVSRHLGLPTWNKPSLACLASRFPYGTEISSPRLKQVEKAEDHLRSLGFGQLRVRYHGELARVEVEPAEIPRFLDPDLREKVVRGLKEAGFVYVTLDLQGYRTGAMNETLSRQDDGQIPKELKPNMGQITRIRKIVLTGLFAALAVLLSGIHFPIGPTKVFPFQHMVNAVAGVLIGPWYGALAALIAAIIRNAMGTGTIFAFPGGIPGAIAVGLAYRYTRRDWAALLEPVGTGGIGVFAVTLLLGPLMGKEFAFAFFLHRFYGFQHPGIVLGVFPFANPQADQSP